MVASCRKNESNTYPSVCVCVCESNTYPT